MHAPGVYAELSVIGLFEFMAISELAMPRHE